MIVVTSQDWVPKKIFLTKGKGISKERLTSFELALREAGIASLNLITVSSILPPNCEFVTKEEGIKFLKPGQVVPVVLARSDSNTSDDIVSSGVGVAIPKNNEHYGYLSEHHCIGMDDYSMEEYVEDLAAEMLATTYGVNFDPDASWDEKRELWKIDNRIVKTKSIIQTAELDTEGYWCTTVCAAVLIL
ncbi:MAG: arginine decarboxylase, pyruvoyl-dependent [Candidatus Poseidoniia archaeon]|nr:arginine decarboxylase, pyruvoyl-dependent [Candidatus Poseidoniia archaeon]